MALFKRKKKEAAPSEATRGSAEVEPEGRNPEPKGGAKGGASASAEVLAKEKKEKKPETQEPTTEKKAETGDVATRAVKSFWISEKSTDLQQSNQYSFLIDTRANKSQVAREVEQRFGITVKKVNTINHRGKPKRWGGHAGHQARFKKAIITLKKGDSIETI